MTTSAAHHEAAAQHAAAQDAWRSETRTDARAQTRTAMEASDVAGDPDTNRPAREIRAAMAGWHAARARHHANAAMEAIRGPKDREWAGQAAIEAHEAAEREAEYARAA